MSDHDELQTVLAAHDERAQNMDGDWLCACGAFLCPSGDDRLDNCHREHIARTLVPLIREHETRSRAEALKAVEWPADDDYSHRATLARWQVLYRDAVGTPPSEHQRRRMEDMAERAEQAFEHGRTKGRAEGVAAATAAVGAVLDDLPSRYTVGPQNFLRVMDLQAADLRAALADLNGGAA